ncbi:DUF2568 domain-containing protein [Bifidobacterium sp. ESL0775]|uniref:DUF2568 domain-containing protein n=1 Tax=Bifidobacterium sp. ESL0775 TaxID=2983230 RepID=UPI0023F9B9C1|nr:DUF2568 domain-containing protein [Bifidobacterium sp. ESL0775]WEV68556.1 DUF2568 domain-containing protein [Bifidobacterium sp. ESL0775]
MNILSAIVAAIRFLLEIATVIGLVAGGGFLSKNGGVKFLWIVIGVIVIIVWARYGAPSSAHVLPKYGKFCLELVVYTIGSIGFLRIFGISIGLTYIFIAIIDLILMYALSLE